MDSKNSTARIKFGYWRFLHNDNTITFWHNNDFIRACEGHPYEMNE